MRRKKTKSKLLHRWDMLKFFVEIYSNALDRLMVVLEKLSMLHDFSVHADMFAAQVFESLLKC